jgi:hypothetical protein
MNLQLFLKHRETRIFFPEFNIRLYDKNSESDYYFFPPPKSEYFFQQHWESEYWFCKEIREDNFRFWWMRVHDDASQGMYMSKIEICFFTARIVDLSRLQFTSDKSEFIPDYI